MNSYNKVHANDISTVRNQLTQRQANKLARFKDAFIALDRRDNKPIVVLDEGEKPEVTAMCIKALRMNVHSSRNVRHGSITWFAPSFNGKIGTHNKN